MKKLIVLQCLSLLVLVPFNSRALAPDALDQPAYEDVVLNTVDNWEIFARYSKPRADNPVIILLHSRGQNRGVWSRFADSLKHWGYGHLALDFRGHGFSITQPSGSTVTYKSFSRTGMDNQFNKMTRDVEAAIQYLSEQGVPEEKIILIGAGLGANVAIKVAALYRSIPMIAVLSPSLNAYRDVLTVNPLRVYGKRPILLITGSGRGRFFREFLLLNDIARISAGALRVTTIIRQKVSGTRLLDKLVTLKIFEWLRNPERPPEVAVETGTIFEDLSLDEHEFPLREVTGE